MTHALRRRLLLDVSTGELLPDRAVLIDEDRIAGVVRAYDVPATSRSATTTGTDTPSCSPAWLVAVPGDPTDDIRLLEDIPY